MWEIIKGDDSHFVGAPDWAIQCVMSKSGETVFLQNGVKLTRSQIYTTQ